MGKPMQLNNEKKGIKKGEKEEFRLK